MRCALRAWWLVLGGVTACSVQPEGFARERARAEQAGVPFAQAFAERQLPPLAADAGLPAWLAYAERRNGAVEAAWQRWVTALEQVPQAGTQDTTAMLGAQHRLDGGSALDRTGLALMNDAMNNLLLPGRLEARAEAALQQAKVAAAAFDRARLQLQREVAEAFWALALRDEEIRLQQELVRVLTMQVPSVRVGVTAGRRSQADMVGAEVLLLRAEAALAGLAAGRPALVASLRAVAAVEAGCADPRPTLAELEPLADAEQIWLERALRHNPDLEVARAEHAAAVAEVVSREWMRAPEFSLQGMLMGDGAQVLTGAMTLPFLRHPAIEAAVRQAEAEVRAALALRQQAGQDALAVVLTGLAELDAACRERQLLRAQVLPRVRSMQRSARANWSAGRGEFGTVTAAAAMAVEVEVQAARLQAAGLAARARLALAAGELVTADPLP